MRKLLTVVVVLWVVGLTAAPPAGAHRGGKAEPRIAARVSGGPGLVRVITVRLTDVDSKTPVAGATVTAFAEMTRPHVMRTRQWRFAEGPVAVHRAKVEFVMAASWTVDVQVSGENVISAGAEFPVRISPAGDQAPRAPGPTTAPGLTTLRTTLEDRLQDRDLLTMAILWLHTASAMGWIVGVLVMAIALSSEPGVLAAGLRARIADGYRVWGAWLHWAFVPLIVATGIYNMLYVTPFTLAWRPSQFRALADVSYGPLYEAILIVKLGLFASLLITGTYVLHRTIRPRPVSASSHNPGSGALRTLGSALGPAGIFYLATVPLILGAAMALRYVHVLSHVGEVLQTS